MESNRVRIRPAYSPNPKRQENYILFCHSHTVRVTVTATLAVVRSWIYKVRYRHRFQLRNGRLVVGLGVQWNPESNDVAATLQLCVGCKCLIFQLKYADQSPAILRRFLSDTDATFVGVRNYSDAKLLAASDHRLRVSQLVDLRYAMSDLRSASMESMAATILGMPGIEKEEWVGRSDWGDAWLSEEQVKYASVDAFLASLMGKKLKVWKWSSSDDSDD